MKRRRIAVELIGGKWLKVSSTTTLREAHVGSSVHAPTFDAGHAATIRRDLRTSPDVMYTPFHDHDPSRQRADADPEARDRATGRPGGSRPASRPTVSTRARETGRKNRARRVCRCRARPERGAHARSGRQAGAAGVFFLLTALLFHGLRTQAPTDVWIALSEKARKPRLDDPRLRVARFAASTAAVRPSWPTSPGSAV